MNEWSELMAQVGSQVVRSTLVVAGLLFLRQFMKKFVPAKWLYLGCVLGSLWLLVPVTPPSLVSAWRCVPAISARLKDPPEKWAPKRKPAENSTRDITPIPIDDRIRIQTG